MFDIECPYCGHGQDICHDDGYGYEEGVRHHQQCEECDKFFAFETSISFYYEPDKITCDEGKHHLAHIYSGDERGMFEQKRCEDCDYRTEPVYTRMWEHDNKSQNTDQ